MTTNYLHNLSVKQLIAILKHVQNGHRHLSKTISKQEYRDLLSIGHLSNNQLDRIKCDRQEKLGNVAIVVNTILTSCFGAWLGFNAFREHSIVSPLGFIIILVAMGFGFLTGFLSYMYTYRQARLAYNNQELCNVERIIIEIINNKRETKIEKVQLKIHAILYKLKFVSENDTAPNKLFDGLGCLKIVAVDQHFSALVEKAINRINRNIEKLSRHVKLTSGKDNDFNSTDFMLNNSLTNASYIKVLTKTELVSHHKVPEVHTWLRNNIGGIMVGLLPTFLGSFASMFVFLNGLPALFDQLHIHFGFTLNKIWYLKEAGLFCALSISIYFAYSHIHSNYKAYKRAKQLEISESKIAKMTTQMLQLTSQLHYWYRIFYQLELIEQLSEYKPQQSRSLEKTTSANLFNNSRA